MGIGGGQRPLPSPLLQQARARMCTPRTERVDAIRLHCVPRGRRALSDLWSQKEEECPGRKTQAVTPGIFPSIRVLPK